MNALAVLLALLVGFTPCASEDSNNCVWDAAVSGNGTGTSFVDVAGVAFYIGGDA